MRNPTRCLASLAVLALLLGPAHSFGFEGNTARRLAEAHFAHLSHFDAIEAYETKRLEASGQFVLTRHWNGERVELLMHGSPGKGLAEGFVPKGRSNSSLAGMHSSAQTTTLAARCTDRGVPPDAFQWNGAASSTRPSYPKVTVSTSSVKA